MAGGVLGESELLLEVLGRRGEGGGVEGRAYAAKQAEEVDAAHLAHSKG